MPRTACSAVTIALVPPSEGDAAAVVALPQRDARDAAARVRREVERLAAKRDGDLGRVAERELERRRAR